MLMYKMSQFNVLYECYNFFLILTTQNLLFYYLLSHKFMQESAFSINKIYKLWNIILIVKLTALFFVVRRLEVVEPPLFSHD